MATFSELINRVLVRLSQVSGTGTQIYGEDRVGEMIQHKFDVLFDLAYWDQFMTLGVVVALDGTNGTITTDLTDLVKRIVDFESIFIENSERQLGKAPHTMNLANLSGTQPRVYSANSSAADVITVWPKTSTGNIIISYRTKPDDFTPEDTVNFDNQAIILGATYDYLEDDGTNVNATQKFKDMFDARVNQLLKIRSDAPVPLDAQASIPTGFEVTLLP